jgi:hypothetical protein
MLRQSREVTQAQRGQTAIELQQELRGLKDACEQAMAKTLDLSVRIIEARSSAHLPVTVGHAALAKLAAANGDLTDGLGAIIEAHQELASVAEHLGLRVTGWGAQEDCPALASGVQLRTAA